MKLLKRLSQQKEFQYAHVFYILIGLVFLFLALRSGTKGGDFIGYIRAGEDAALNRPIYDPFTNTWPPLFSIFCIPLYYLDNISAFGVRFLWSLGSILAFVGVIRESLKMLNQNKISNNLKEFYIELRSWNVIIPVAILTKFVMDNLANIQINIYLLLLILIAINCFIAGKYGWAGFILAATISLKAFPLLFLFYFIFKREWRVSLWTLLFLALLNFIPFLYWGSELAGNYYSTWFIDVVSKSDFPNHRNQSIFGTSFRLLTALDPKHGLYTNIMDLPADLVKKLTYLFVACISIIPAAFLWRKIKIRKSISSVLEYTIIFACVPILSPISWKAYFIFLWLPYFVLYGLLYSKETPLPQRTVKVLKYLFVTSVVLNVFSSELFMGPYFSDVLESYSVLTIGSTLVLLMLFYLRVTAYQIPTQKFEG